MSDREYFKPYRYECPKHGSGWAEIDECPECMKEDDERQLSNEQARLGKCPKCGKSPKFTRDGNQEFVVIRGAIGLMAGDYDEDDHLAYMCYECWAKAEAYLEKGGAAKEDAA